MTPQDVERVQSTWAKVVPIRDTAATLFYGKLFELDPSLKSLFKGDMTAQGPAVKALGQRHVGYGVKPQDYDTVAAALLWTLGQGLGDDFTPEVKASWTEVYVLLATTMQSE